MNTEDQNISRTENRDNGIRTGLALTPPLLAGLLFVAALTPCSLLAQANTAKAPPPSNRCLLVVETSRAMQRRADATLRVVQDLLNSGLAGQLRRGDTLGVWTYNESLYAGRFPLQTWSPEAQEDIALRTLAFLKAQKNEKQASFDRVLPALRGVIKDSPLITIILISSGEEQIQGTPFDGPINEFHQKWHNAQQKARMPFLTVLRGQGGKLDDFTANTPPWPVQMPRLPQETRVAETIQSKLVEAVRNVPSPSVPPLILSGKKAKPVPTQVKVEAPAPAPRVTSTSQSLTVKPPMPAPPPAQIVKAETAPVMPAKPAVALPPKPSPAPALVPEPKAEIVKAPEAKPIASAPAAPQVASALPAPAPRPAALEPAKPSLSPEPKPTPAPKPVTEPKVEVVRAPETKPAAAIPPKAEAASALQIATPKPVPAPVAGREAPLGTIANATTAASAPIPVPQAQAATAIPAETLARSRTIWIAALALAGVAIGIALLLLRRSRTAPAASLITQSLERKNKP